MRSQLTGWDVVVGEVEQELFLLLLEDGEEDEEQLDVYSLPGDD